MPMCNTAHIDYTITGIDDDIRDIAQSHTYDFINPKAGVTFQPSKRAYRLTWATHVRTASQTEATL